ncbi:helix-turn-helix transcriptional regulator [Nocardioides sp. T2.26MG-1]|uniref:helix-turn-helix transcriptional regulator n=1 Tax=Nocardioides sp. T2.26MG-1 TaxID=3041166 RepID=UPI00247780F3|nr:helix-turn-helix transcriptional regulator [Nocardioides sp. T2.26MG-1]CAI9412490.1 hypothetical protein HIDPHFAB_01784 [Nocardioides sp. T2.26MG-1]
MLVGRHDEQRAVGALLAAARLGQSGVLVLTGEPGIGKSALLDHVVAHAGRFRVLRVTGTEAERDLPFAGLAQLLRPVVDRVDRLPEPQAAALGVALALRAGDGDVDRFAVSAATLTLVATLGEDRPVLVVVDDAHLLDRPSAEALSFVARRLLADAVLLVAAVRPGASDLWPGDLPRLPLARLDPGSSVQLAADAAPVPLTGDQADRIAMLGGGNPLAIRVIAQQADAIGTRSADLPVPLPDEAARAAFGRLADELEPADLQVLRVVAVAGGDLAVVGRACESEGLALEALGRAERAGLVAVAPDRVEFAHPLARSAVYGGLSPDDRRRLHRRVAYALPPGDLDRRAWHLSAAALGPAEPLALELEGVGVRAAGRGAFAVAASAHERAAQLSTSDLARARRYLAAGEAAWHAGEDARATSLLEEALRHDSSPVGRARARAVSGLVAARGGSLLRARDLLLDAAAEAEADAPDEALGLYAEVVDVCFYLLDTRGASAAAERIERLLAGRAAAGAAPSRSAAVASIAVGMARVFQGVPGADPIRAGVTALTRLPHPARPAPPAQSAQSAWEVIGPLYLRESGAGRELMVQALERRRQAAALGTLPHLLFHLARVDATEDRWPRAEAAYAEAVALARECGQATELGASLAGLAWVLGRQGREVECRSVAAEATAVASGRELHVVTAWIAFALAELDLSLGAVPQAVVGFGGLEDLLELHEVRDPDLSPVPELVEALVRVGDLDRARRSAGTYLRRAETKGQPWSLARAARVRAMLAPAEVAEEGFLEALAWHRATPDRFELARTRLVYGERLRRARRRTAAREQLEQALGDFDRLGARRWAEAALAELQATGQTVRRREAGPIVELTARELQIGLLLADGRTTREAAAALFLSPKTVEYHLRHIYTKLDIGSRAELTARLRAREE